ncbi:MAG TPA: alpha/beta hydrolase [Micromonosporaceae bacterium]
MTTPLGVAAATEHEIRTPDARVLRVFEAGDPDGDLVVVHHGTPCSGRLAAWWAADARARGIRLVGYDRPGYGGSTRMPGRRIADAAMDAAAIADALGVDRFRTWGVSGGGPHALACAALLPDRCIAAAAIASVAPYQAAGLDWLDGMGTDNVDEFGAAVAGAATLGPYLTEASREVVAAGPIGLAEALRSLLPPVDVAVLTGEVGSFVYHWMAGGLTDGHLGWLDDDLAVVDAWGFDLGAIPVPVLLVQGRQDLMVPFAHGAWLADQIPGVTTRFTDDDGHLTLLRDVAAAHAWLLSAA